AMARCVFRVALSLVDAAPEGRRAAFVSRAARLGIGFVELAAFAIVRTASADIAAIPYLGPFVRGVGPLAATAGELVGIVLQRADRPARRITFLEELSRGVPRNPGPPLRSMPFERPLAPLPAGVSVHGCLPRFSCCRARVPCRPPASSEAPGH